MLYNTIKHFTIQMEITQNKLTYTMQMEIKWNNATYRYDMPYVEFGITYIKVLSLF